MIVLDKLRTLIFTPGKCGSTSLHEAFPRSVVGPQGPWKTLGHLNYRDSIGKHTMVVPYDYQHWRLLVVVRNTTDYLRSLWRHWNIHCEPMPFDQFTAKRATWRARGEANPWFYWYDMDDYLAELPGRRELVPLAQLNATVRELTGVELPTLNASIGQ